jgi:hypothetical protein
MTRSFEIDRGRGTFASRGGVVRCRPMVFETQSRPAEKPRAVGLRTTGSGLGLHRLGGRAAHERAHQDPAFRARGRLPAALLGVSDRDGPAVEDDLHVLQRAKRAPQVVVQLDFLAGNDDDDTSAIPGGMTGAVGRGSHRGPCCHRPLPPCRGNVRPSYEGRNALCRSSRATFAKAHMFASRSETRVSTVKTRSTGPATATHAWPAASP